MTNPYIAKLNELIADINENEITSHDNPKSLKGWCEKWREEATMCSIALYEAKIEQNPSGDAISRKIISAFLSGLISDETERKKALQYINELPPVNPQPCEDAISRQAALGCCRNEWEEEVEIRLKSLPSVNPTKTGHWIAENSVLRCSECNEGVARYDNYAYCPYCGARMVEPQESEDKE